MISDLRFGFRALRKSPGFSFVAAMTLALAIAANCVVFSVAYAVLLRPLPYKDPEGLQQVFWGYKGGEASRGPSMPDFLEWKQRNSVFEDMALTSDGVDSLRLGDYPELVRVTRATTTLFHLLGVKPVLGRAFSAEEGTPGRDKGVALLGYDFWQERFHGDPNVLGRVLDLQDRRAVVIGVLPPGFKFTYPKAVQVLYPMPENRAEERTSWAGGGTVT